MIAAAALEPQPAFSTYTARAICGSSLGANAMQTEWSLPCGFSAVPVLAHIAIPEIRARQAVPPFTAYCIASAIKEKWSRSIDTTCRFLSSGRTGWSPICLTR